MNNYDDIIDLPHHVSATREPMPLAARAAQFAPFAALTGHDEAIAETARLTTARVELTAEERELISRRLAAALESHAPIAVTYFVADPRKSGGSYATLRGRIRRADPASGLLTLDPSAAPIPLADILAVEIINDEL